MNIGSSRLIEKYTLIQYVCACVCVCVCVWVCVNVFVEKLRKKVCGWMGVCG